MKRSYRAFFFLVPILAALAACASLGVPTPQTFNEKVAVAYSTVTSVRQSALTLLEAGSLTAAEAQSVNNDADTARASIEAAETLHATDANAGATKLDDALSALTLLQSYLTKKKGP